MKNDTRKLILWVGVPLALLSIYRKKKVSPLLEQTEVVLEEMGDLGKTDWRKRRRKRRMRRGGKSYRFDAMKRTRIRQYNRMRRRFGGALVRSINALSRSQDTLARFWHRRAIRTYALLTTKYSRLKASGWAKGLKVPSRSNRQAFVRDMLRRKGVSVERFREIAPQSV